MPRKAPPFDPRPLAIQTLAETIADPSPKVLIGTAKSPGFFNGRAAKTHQAAEFCLQEKWLQATGEILGAGAQAKPLYRLTPGGMQAILDHSPALTILQGLEVTLSRQQGNLASLASGVQTLQSEVQRLSEQANTKWLNELTHRAMDRLKPPNVEEILAKFVASGHSRPDRQESNEAWQEEVVRRAAQTDASNPLPLPNLYQDLTKSWPSLTLGQFQDGLRTLRDAGRIRLRPYTRAYAEIAGHREAMFLDGEVMYYVRGN